MQATSDLQKIIAKIRAEISSDSSQGYHEEWDAGWYSALAWILDELEFLQRERKIENQDH